MKILGIDPSLRSTGFGVIESKGSQLTALCHGHVKNPPTVLPSRCLVRIADAMLQLIADHQPEAVAIEGLIYVQNTRIAFTLGQVPADPLAKANPCQYVYGKTRIDTNPPLRQATAMSFFPRAS